MMVDVYIVVEKGLDRPFVSTVNTLSPNPNRRIFKAVVDLPIDDEAELISRRGTLGAVEVKT